MSEEVPHHHLTYNDVHKLIRRETRRIAQEFVPDLLIAIGGGGFFPARVLRTLLRESTTNKSLQIRAIGLSLYEPVPGVDNDQIGKEVIRTQWLDPNSGEQLLGKKILVVDEIDDTRQTLHYAISELRKDVHQEALKHPESERKALLAQTKFAIFVVHNKLKTKLAEIPEDVLYFAGEGIVNRWIDYPWEATDIEDHDLLAAKDI